MARADALGVAGHAQRRVVDRVLYKLLEPRGRSRTSTRICLRSAWIRRRRWCPGVPDGLRAVVMKCLEKPIGLRYQWSPARVRSDAVRERSGRGACRGRAVRAVARAARPTPFRARERSRSLVADAADPGAGAACDGARSDAGEDAGQLPARRDADADAAVDAARDGDAEDADQHQPEQRGRARPAAAARARSDSRSYGALGVGYVCGPDRTRARRQRRTREATP